MRTGFHRQTCVAETPWPGEVGPYYAEVVFRRRVTAEKNESAAAEQEAADSSAATATGKGRPTPKRREAARRRRVYTQAPKDRKEAAKMMRERQKTGSSTGNARSAGDVRREQQEALRKGHEDKLGPRDAGPIRKLVRDVVDSRRGVGGYFLFTTLGVLLFQILLSVATSQKIVTAEMAAQIQVYLMYAWYALILLVAFDSFVLVRRMKQVVKERHPDQRERGLPMYAVMRSLQIRRLRLPPPKVKPGEGVRD